MRKVVSTMMLKQNRNVKKIVSNLGSLLVIIKMMVLVESLMV